MTKLDLITFSVRGSGSGLITVDTDYSIRVSGQIRERYNNGVLYYDLEGQELKVLPQETDLQPNLDHLEWHRHTIFVP